ncbi:Gfo/Idh/MocA family oxidoreductase [Pelagicoccus sp. SDUM812005]|uniref:Gfo/Idh/MocA family protein n=1 Tax=Pelagicoccus sp. SDUM812005 TaxID=3041257 RepID=UPI00280D473D|nr:Gfo/Idh/MocA family oxidoreductase [Pelagicoccus sp. SDUM812005]MDQ8180924.1 Gfo/Idh/MocA family oxidoreductase [Pelagicoccus sp. SDUM812005]
MLKVGIIGYGKMGRIRHKALVGDGRAEVVAIFDPEPIDDALCAVVDSENEILENPEIDAIFVCAPNFRIPELAKRGLRSGKHVFAEKPPGFTAADVEGVRLVEAESEGLKLMYGFNHRHHASIKKMKSLIESGELGKILWMRGRYGKEVDDSYFETWRADPKLAGGGIMLDQGIHMLDLFMYFCGGFDVVHALVSNLYWKIDGGEDNVFAIFKNSETGVCASLHSTMTQWRYLFSLEIFLEGGALILNGLKTSSGVYGDEDLAIKRNDSDAHGGFAHEEHIVYHTDVSWASEIGHFIDSIEKRQPVLQGTSLDALNLMKIMDRIYQGS